LLENFFSNETGYKYKAYVAFERIEGKVSFEFDLSAVKKVAAKKAA
jgi:DNA topoisomerase III